MGENWNLNIGIFKYKKNYLMRTTAKVFQNSIRKYGNKTALRQKIFGLWK